MHLLIDIGNTSLKWTLHDGFSFTPMGSAEHHGAVPVDVLAAWDGLSGIERISFARVGPACVADALCRASVALWGRQPRALTVTDLQRAPPVVRIAYREPERFGLDRWLALIAAHPICAGPKLLIDLGTAITFDVLRADGQHRGGLILPGMRLLRDSLLAGTAIPTHESVETDQLLGTSTGSAIASATLHAPAALAERLYRRIRDEDGQEPSVFLTGGDAERILPALQPRTATLVPDLVLRGLARTLDGQPP